jgi:hypothetical protein
MRRVPSGVVAGFVATSEVLEVSGEPLPFAVPVDGGLAVGVPEPDVADMWALTVFDPSRAADAARRTLDRHEVVIAGESLRFGFPIIEQPGDLMRFATGLRLNGNPRRGAWTLADERASAVLMLEGPENALTVTWWDEWGGLAFAYPVAVVEDRPSELERTLGARWMVPLHRFIGQGHASR